VEGRIRWLRCGQDFKLRLSDEERSKRKAGKMAEAEANGEVGRQEPHRVL